MVSLNNTRMISKPMCFLATEAPEIELDASLRKGLAVRAGCPIRLFAVIRGRPAPKVTWKRLGVDNVVRRGHVDQVDTMSFLVIPESTREDSGKYSLTLSNSAGEKAVFVRVKVLGKKQTNNDKLNFFSFVFLKKRYKIFSLADKQRK